MSEIVVLTKSELTEIISNAVADGIRIHISGETKSEMQPTLQVKYPLFSEVEVKMNVRTYNCVYDYMTNHQIVRNASHHFTIKDVADRVVKRLFLSQRRVGAGTVKDLGNVLTHYGLILK